MAKKNHPVIPPTKVQAKKSKGTIKAGKMIHHGRFNRPEVLKEGKETWKNKFNAVRRSLGVHKRKIINYLKS